MAVKKKVAGVKRKAVSGVKKKVVSGVKPKRKRVSGVKSVGVVDQGKKIIGAINGLEKDYKKANDKEMKKFLAVAINAEHDKLDALKAKLKSLNKKKK